MSVTITCSCDEVVAAAAERDVPSAYLAHVRATHPDWPFPDVAVEVVGEALLRLSGPRERLDEVGRVTVEPVMPDHLEDWLAFFDHHAFVDRPWLAGCYCFEQHAEPSPPAVGWWRSTRQAMTDLFVTGDAYGYLALVDGGPAGWANAAMRAGQRYARGDETDATTITLSCFNIGPGYRGHGLAAVLLDRVIADAPGRGALRVEAYPTADARPFRGSLELYRSRGFHEVRDLGFGILVRLEVVPTRAPT